MAKKLMVGSKTTFTALAAYRKFIRGKMSLEEYKRTSGVDVVEPVTVYYDDEDDYPNGDHAGENT